MVDFLADIWNSVLSFFDMWMWYLTHFPDFYEAYIQHLMKYGTYFMFWATEQAVIVAFQITQEFLESFDYTENVSSAWNAIPAAPRAILGFLQIPTCCNILISAIGTRFVLKFVPFAGV